jgi:hypothetical protein
MRTHTHGPTYTQAYTHGHTDPHTHMHTHTDTHAHAHAHAHTHTHTRTRTHTRADLHASGSSIESTLKVVQAFPAGLDELLQLSTRRLIILSRVSRVEAMPQQQLEVLNVNPSEPPAGHAMNKHLSVIKLATLTFWGHRFFQKMSWLT